MTHTLVPSILENIPSDYPTKLINELLLLLDGPPELYNLGNWLFPGWSYRSERGKLLLYLTEVGQLVIAARCRSTNETSYYHCFGCPTVRNCSHTTLLPRIGTLSIDDEPFIDRPYMEPLQPDALLLSTELYPIDIKRDQELCTHIVNRTNYGVQVWLEDVCPTLVFTPEVSVCCGYTCTTQAGSRSNTDGMVEVFGLSSVTHLNRIERNVCVVCNKVFFFDGRSLGLLNVGNRYLFCVEVVLDILEFKANNGTPVHSYWKSRVNTLLRTFEHSKVADTRKKWMNMTGRVSEIVTQFLMLVRYPDHTFRCCENPQVVCVDGIVLSVESKRLRETSAPWRDTNTMRGRFTTRQQRSLVPVASRVLLKAYIKEGLKGSDAQLLLLKYRDNPVIKFILCNTIFDEEKSVHHCPEMLKAFVVSTTKDIAPASAIAPPSVWEIVEAVLNTRRTSLDASATMSQLAPVLNQVLTHISTLIDLPESLDTAVTMLDYVLKVSKGCYTNQGCPGPNYIHPITSLPDDHHSPYGDLFEEAVATGAYFPGMPYHSVVRDINFGGELTNCSKLYKSTGRLGAGTLVFWCGTHRKCIGFYLLPSAESCQHVYNILVTRFTKMPRVLIYDNGCNLSEYILNRAPTLFKDTYILSDGFHWKNHVNCSSAFNSKLYPGLNSTTV